MSAFTLAYLARLEVWGLAAALFQGGLVLSSWLAWSRATANATASLRHRLACAHFAALAVLPALTVAILHWTVVSMGDAALSGSPAAELPPLLVGYRGALRLSLPLAVLWLAGAALMALRLALDARRLARLRREPAPTALVETVGRFAGRIGVTTPDVQIADITGPQIIGLWRPVLLAPRDLALRLPTAEQDAVLLHELAHVRRGDFGWNLLQRLVLALLWFHPAAWALYGHLSREREVCCDALAVRNGASASGLARALVRLAENQAHPGPAMAISNGGNLATRVHRLVGMDRPGSPRGRARAVALAMSVLCLIALAAGRLGLTDPAMGDLYIASAFGPTISVTAHDPSGSFALKLRHGRVIEASVEKRRLAQSRILQDGNRVILMGAMRKPIVALTITPRGRVQWKAGA